MVAGGPQFDTTVLLLIGTLVFLGRGCFLGADVREHDEAVRRIRFGQAGARSRAGGSFHRRHIGSVTDHRVDDNPAATAEDPVSVAMVGPPAGTAWVAASRMTGIEDRGQTAAVSSHATAATVIGVGTDTYVAADTGVTTAADAAGVGSA